MWSYVLAAVPCLAIVLIPSGAVYLAGIFLAGVAYGVMLTATYALREGRRAPGGLGRALGLWGMYSIVFATAGASPAACSRASTGAGCSSSSRRCAC